MEEKILKPIPQKIVDGWFDQTEKPKSPFKSKPDKSIENYKPKQKQIEELEE